MIDFHNHLIPEVDDGSKSIEMSIDMLLEAQKQGITDIVSTIHYQHPKMDGKNTEYSFVLMANSTDYNCYVGRLGETVIG